jgi:hypothetical protein
MKINEIDEKNFYSDNFNCVFKSRNRHVGGVGFLIRKEINYTLINDLSIFEKECLCLKINLNGKEIIIVNYYNSPSNILCLEMLEFIKSNYKNYILCGDLNSKNIEFGCKESNKNGEILYDFLVHSRAIIF